MSEREAYQSVQFHGQKAYLMAKKPPTSNTVKPMASRLKYLSMNVLIGAPYFQISQLISTKRSPG